MTSEGEVWTTPRGARRMIERGTAERQPDKTVWLIESDRRISSETPPDVGNGIPDLLSMIRQFPVDVHYQDDRAVLKYWPDQANYGIAA
jgi:hypothetical protein